MREREIQKQVYGIRELLFNLKDYIECMPNVKYDDLLDVVNESIFKLADYE